MRRRSYSRRSRGGYGRGRRSVVRRRGRSSLRKPIGFRM